MTLAKQRTPLMKPGLLPDARHVILPSGIASTGFPAVEATSRRIGIQYDDWQRDLNRCILAKDKDGLYAADTAVISICRQAGKTFNIGGLVFADSIINPGTTTVWTAHRFKVARETFNELRSIARSPLLVPHIDFDDITTAAGNECIPFRNGSRIVFAARERGAIRGFTKVRRLVLDEGQILTAAAMADLAPTMNQAVNPQIIIMGTPPKPSDPGEVFSEIRRDALAGDSEGALYVEFSADPDAPATLSSPSDWEQVEKANPSYPHRTNKRAIRRLRKLLTDDGDYRREVLGVWDSTQRVAVFGRGKWEAVPKVARPKGLELGALGVAVSIDLEKAAIVGAADLPDGNVLVRSLQHGPQPDEWLVEAVAGVQEQHGVPVIIDGKGPAADFIPALKARLGDALYVVAMSEVLDACSGIYKAVRGEEVVHACDGEQDEIDLAVRDAVKRDVGDRWAWGRRKSGLDISPLEAMTLAHWGLSSQAAKPFVSAYADTDLIVI